jgi:hypothetical protein
VSDPPPLTFTLDPDGAANIGDIVTVEIVASGAVGLGAFELSLEYPLELLEIVGVGAGGFLASGGNQVILIHEPRRPFLNGYNQQTGVETVAAVSFGPAPGVDGQGVAAIARVRLLACEDMEMSVAGPRAATKQGIEITRVDAAGAVVACLTSTGIRSEAMHDGTGVVAAPNPFRDETRIAFVLHREGIVRVEVFDLHGRRVRLLAYAPFGEGTHVVTWDGRDAHEERVPSGVYFVRISGKETTLTERVVMSH